MIKTKRCHVNDVEYEINAQIEYENNRNFACKIISIIPITYEPKDNGGLKLSDVEIYYNIS